MAINRVSFASESVTTNTDSVIEVRYSEPPLGTTLTVPETPGKLIGYYDSLSDTVKLYIVSSNGLRYQTIQ